MGKPLLMLAEEGYKTPVDYLNLMQKYPTGQQCLDIVEAWLAENLQDLHRRAETISKQADHIKLATELRELHLGEYVAELEEDRLSDYFVETSGVSGGIGAGRSCFCRAAWCGKDSKSVRSSYTTSERQAQSSYSDQTTVV